MKLYEIQNPNPVFAWLEPAKGPEDIQGVRLAFIDPIDVKHERMIASAEEGGEKQRADRLRANLAGYQKKGQKFFTPDFGWWQNEEDFHQSKEGFGGITKGRVLTQNPNLVIAPSKKEAIKSAKESGII